jgi:23S rRNA (pseudouridine1915-N3)-methyltransferase
MRITVAAVGRLGKGTARPEAALWQSFADRLSWPVSLKEVVAKGKPPPNELARREAEVLRGAIPKEATVVALDGGGRSLDSRAFAKRLAAWRDGGVRDLAFLIGGAEGLDRGLISDAELVLSLGAMTWPHLLVRGMLAEQIFRAQSILDGHPYHRQ